MNIETVIEEKLLHAFEPIQLDVVNESARSQYQESKAQGDDFFKVVIISKAFEGKRIGKRHKAITQVLAAELTETISRLALHTYTEKEWRNYYENSMSLSAHCLRR